jgi:hypothetical protein
MIIHCLIEAADLLKLQALNARWHAAWYPRRRVFYARCDVPGETKHRKLLMHRYIMDSPSGLEVDHTCHDTLDNRRCNLEIKTRSGNGMNRRGANRHSKTGHRGISPHRDGKFILQLTIAGKKEYIGYFSTIEEAIAVRNQYPGYKRQERASA